MTVFGYARISDRSQNIGRQIKSLEVVGCEEIFKDHASGKDDNRPGFQELIKKVKKGDIIYIHDLDRFMRSTKHLLLTVDELKEKGVALKSIQDTWLDTSSDNPFHEVLLSVMGALATYERKISKRRQQEGIALAKVNGIHLGRPRKLKAREEKIKQMHFDIIQQKRTVKEASNLYGVPIASYYRYIKLLGLE